jgi:hypothetical protein
VRGGHTEKDELGERLRGEELESRATDESPFFVKRNRAMRVRKNDAVGVLDCDPSLALPDEFAEFGQE